MIRNAADAPTARQELINSYGLSEAQCDLQMQLRRLTALKQKNSPGTRGYKRRIADLQDILARRDRILEIIGR